MNRFYVTSDWHLDAVTAGIRRRAEVTDAVLSIYDRARKEGAGVVFAGDLCDPDALDSPRHTALPVVINRQYGDHIQLLWLVGNHDIVEDGCQTTTLDPLAAAGGSMIDNPEQLDFGEFTLGLLPYTAKTHPYDPAAAVAGWGNRCDVVIGHLDKAELQPGSESDMQRGRRLEWPTAALAQHQKDAALIGGHYHRGQQLGNLHIIGAPARFNFGESDHEPGYLSVELVKGRGKKRSVKVERHVFPDARRVYSVPIGSVPAGMVQRGDIIRLLHTPQEITTDEGAAVEGALLAEGADAVRFKTVSSPDQAAIALAERPSAATVTAEDGFDAAQRLAREWPAAEEQFRTQLEQLVVQLKDQSR